MEDTRKIQIAENKFPMLIMGDENRFLKTTYFQYIQYCESLSASFFKGRSTEVQNNILKANFGLTNEDILSWAVMDNDQVILKFLNDRDHMYL